MKPFEFQKTDRNPALAAILSFLLMGLGQAYNGEIVKAVLFLMLYAISIFLTFFMIGFVTTPILWIWSMVDAYRSSQKINQVGTARVLPSNASPFLGGTIMKRYLWVILLALTFPVAGWGKTPAVVPERTISLVFSSNVQGELEPCG